MAAKTKNWFEGVKSEWKKLIWPSKDDMVRKTTAVVCASAALGVAIAALDFLFQHGIEAVIGLF